jgi:hypothetical protein
MASDYGVGELNLGHGRLDASLSLSNEFTNGLMDEVSHWRDHYIMIKSNTDRSDIYGFRENTEQSRI